MGILLSEIHFKHQPDVEVIHCSKWIILVNACHVHHQIESAADRYKDSRPTDSLLLKCSVMS
jgi:hypothetical protein